MSHGSRTNSAGRNRPNRGSKHRTIADCLFWFDSPALRNELEQYRIAHEAEHGPTDLTRRYTCTWPTEQQQWLIDTDPGRYFEGLPPFVKAFIRTKAESNAREGNLDGMSDMWIQLFASGHLQNDSPER